MDNKKEKKVMYYEYYEDGQVYQESEIRNGVLNGKRTWYYMSGRIKQAGNYIDGKCDGEFVSYYENGEIKSVINYSNGGVLGLKDFKIKSSNKTKIFNFFKEERNNDLNGEETNITEKDNANKKRVLKVFVRIILLIAIILSVVYFKILDRADNRQIQSDKGAVKTVKKAEKTVTNISKEKITENKKLPQETIENKKK